MSNGKDVFFIEMNTRLQVEHPVTELITGINLVEWQLRVAFGERLPLAQQDIRFHGHAIEARVYAENPQKNFMPSVGRIKTWQTPPAVDGLRIDAGYRKGDTVSPYYDAMLAKVIAWAPTRQAAIDKLNHGLQETDVRGVITNIPFLSALVTHPDVRANAIDTGFIERELNNLTAGSNEPGELELCAAVASRPGRRKGRSSQRCALAVANLWLDAGRSAATGVFLPPRAGGRAQGNPALWRWAFDPDHRRAGICLCSFGQRRRRNRFDPRRRHIARGV